MLRPKYSAQVYLYSGIVDMRKSIDGLAAHFGVIRPPVSVCSGHPFQHHPATRFGVIRPPMMT
jgi:hypothetical protein